MDSFQKFINIHAHREAAGPHEWVLRSFRAGELETAPGSRSLNTAWSAGIHPWDAASGRTAEWMDVLQDQLRSGSLWALGEIGLDRSRDIALKTQLQVFEQQIILAEEYRLPVILHSVKAHADLLAFQKSHRLKLAMIIHGYRGKRQMAEELIRAGFHLSFGEALLKAAGDFRELLKEVPARSFFIETDESGVDIKDLYQELAGLRGEKPESLARQLKKNWNKLIAGKDGG